MIWLDNIKFLIKQFFQYNNPAFGIAVGCISFYLITIISIIINSGILLSFAIFIAGLMGLFFGNPKFCYDFFTKKMNND